MYPTISHRDPLINIEDEGSDQVFLPFSSKNLQWRPSILWVVTSVVDLSILLGEALVLNLKLPNLL